MAEAFAGCIAPPAEREASILPPEELRFISLVNSGKAYAARGRAEHAEDAFRAALALRPQTVSVQSDLGASLLAQGRMEEAEDVLLQAREQSPDNFVVRQNYARVLYERGDPARAIAELDEIIDVLNRVPAEELAKIVRSPVGAREMVWVYRSMAAAYFALGQFDEAVCYSALASLSAASIIEAGRHSRLLMSLDRAPGAFTVLRDTITVHKSAVPAKLLLDYGIVLSVLGDNNLAKAALARVLTFPALNRVDRRTTHLARLAIASSENNRREKKLIADALFDEEPKLCEMALVDPEHYWPVAFADKIQELVEKLCHDQDEFLAEE